MHIALLMDLAVPWSRQIALRLAALGHAIHIVSFPTRACGDEYLRATDAFQVEEIEAVRGAAASVHVFSTRIRSGFRYFACGRQLRRICINCRADVLLSMYGGGFAVTAQLSGVRPYAVYVVGSDVLRAGWWRRRVRATALEQAAAVFVNGEYLAEKTRVLAPKANVVPLVMGTDTTYFLPGTAPAELVNVICSRGFLPVYNNEEVIRALALLGDRLDARVTFTSPGPLLPAARRLAARTLSSTIAERVVFLGGVDRAEMRRILRAAHVYVSTSRCDGTSISLLEALACGLLPVLSDIPQNREWVDPTLNNGILVPLDQPASLAAALRRAIGDGSFRARAAEINRRIVLDRADFCRNMDRLASHLADVVATSNSVGA